MEIQFEHRILEERAADFNGKLGPYEEVGWEKPMKKDKNMTKKKIQEIVKKFALEAKRIYGVKLQEIILYGSCARGDFEENSDIDIMILLDIPQEEIAAEREKIFDVTDQLDLDYDVVLTPVFQNYQIYQKYMQVSQFYQNIQKEGVKIA